MGDEKNQFDRLKELLPKGWEVQAKVLGALQRSREIITPDDLLRLILLYLTEGKSFGGTSAILHLEGEWQISKKAVWSRICNSAEWLRWLCEHIYRHQGVLAERPAWLVERNVCLVDGTEEVLPEQERILHVALLH